MSTIDRRYRISFALGLICLALLVLAGCGTAGGTSTPPTSHITPVATVHPPVTYVAIGASDAVGIGAGSLQDQNTKAYVPLLISRLPKGSVALNLGISGATLHDALQQELPQAIAEHPTLITIWLVGNDFRDCTPLQQYGADLDTLLTQLHDQTQAQVFVANAPDFSQLPYFKDGAQGGGACVAGASTAQVHALVVQWNAVIDAAVARHGDTLVNLFSSDLTIQPDYVYVDGFHPSAKGYARLADLFWAQITAHHAVPGY